MTAIRRHRKSLLLALGLVQLGWLLTLPETGKALVLLAGAVLDLHYSAYVLVAPALLAFGVFFNHKLKALDYRWLEWSPFRVKTNIALAPIKYRWVGLLYGLMLAACMPLLALFEELIFRNHTSGWVTGLLWGGLAFGLLHLISLVSIRMTLYLSLVGVCFVGLYMAGGLMAVFVVHASYNLLALALLIAEEHLNGAGLLRRVTRSLSTAQ
jgi:hypothetical protein